MADTFIYTCVNCQVGLTVPTEACGLSAECTECGAQFVLPTLEEVQSNKSEEQEVSAPQQATTEDNSEDEAMQETGTIKIERSSIGMIPELQEQFKMDLGVSSSPKSSSAKKKFTTTKKEETSDKAPSTPKEAPKKKKKWWQFWK